MRLSDLSRSQMMLSNLSRSRGELDKLTAEISSGRRLLTPDGDPEGYNHFLRFKEASSLTAGFIKNIQNTKSELELYENTIDNVTSIIKELKTVVVGASNDAGYRDSAELYQQRVTNLIESMMSLANSNMKGKYMFSGSMTLTKPFEAIKSGTTITAVNYMGDNQPKVFNPDSSERMTLNLSGQEIFMGAAGMDENIFDEMISIISDLQSDTFHNKDEHLNKLDQIHTRLLNKRGSIGTNVQHLEVLQNFMESYKISIDEKAASIEGVDQAMAITELLNQEYVYKATLEVASRLNNLTFLDYIR